MPLKITNFRKINIKRFYKACEILKTGVTSMGNEDLKNEHNAVKPLYI